MFSPSYIASDLVMNIGVWGEVNHGYANFIRINRDVENEVSKLHGRKVLYAHAYYPRGEFWSIYDHMQYNALREKYFANSTLPDIYDKTNVSSKYKPSILAGIWRGIRSRKLPIS